MTAFTFWHHQDATPVWVEGDVAKQADGTFVATSAMVPGYQVPGALMTDATGDFRLGLTTWLAEHPDQMKALSDG